MVCLRCANVEEEVEVIVGEECWGRVDDALARGLMTICGEGTTWAPPHGSKLEIFNSRFNRLRRVQIFSWSHFASKVIDIDS